MVFKEYNIYKEIFPFQKITKQKSYLPFSSAPQAADFILKMMLVLPVCTGESLVWPPMNSYESFCSEMQIF